MKEEGNNTNQSGKTHYPTIITRIDENKEILLEQFKKTPVIEVACKRVGVSRASYYRWRSEDKKFAEDADSALKEGIFLMNDLAESKLIAAIQEGNLTAIIYWLKCHHPSYAIESKTEINIGDNRKIIVSWADGQTVNKTQENREEIENGD